MKSRSRFTRSLALLLSALTLITGLMSSVAQAAVVSNQDVLMEQQTQYDRQQLSALLQREDAIETLQTLGVDPEMVQERVANMTAEELSAFNAQVDEMQAGGSALGVVVLVFLILILLELLGVIDIFPGIRSAV